MIVFENDHEDLVIRWEYKDGVYWTYLVKKNQVIDADVIAAQEIPNKYPNIKDVEKMVKLTNKMLKKRNKR